MSKQAMIDLLTRLTQDRQESQRFKKNPDQVMAGIDLTEEERGILKRAQPEEIRKYLGYSSAAPLGCCFGGLMFKDDGSDEE